MRTASKISKPRRLRRTYLEYADDPRPIGVYGNYITPNEALRLAAWLIKSAMWAKQKRTQTRVNDTRKE